MTGETRDNHLKEGFSCLPTISETIMETISDEYLSKAIPDETFLDAQRVIITGCGDSLAAALATKNLNSEMFEGCDYHVPRTIDLSRHQVLPKGDSAARTMVFVISVSGTGARVTEAMRRCTKSGCATVALTGHPSARMALEARHVIQLNIPKPGVYSPASQTLSYFASVLTTSLIGLHAGMLRGNISREDVNERRREIQSHVRAVCGMLDAIDSQMEVVSERFKEYMGYDFVGAGSDFATAYFGTAKFFESMGALSCLNDSEDWCHINFFMRNRDKIGTIIVACRNSASFSRSLETIISMQKTGRDVLVVTDCDADTFPEGVTVCSLAGTAHDHISSLTNFIPLSMLGNYISIKNGLEYFGGTSDSNPLFSQDGSINTIKSSRIVEV